MTHANFCSEVHHYHSVFNLSRNSRIYDFASYAFDVSYINILQALCAGGCFCVPSEADRKNDFAGSFQRLKANIMTATPTVLRMLDPTLSPCFNAGRAGRSHDIGRCAQMDASD